MKKVLSMIAMAASLLLSSGLVSPVQGAFSYAIQYNNASYSTTVGGTFSANLVVLETVTAPDSSEFATRTLNGAKFRINVGNPLIAKINSFSPTGGLAAGGFVDIGGGGAFVEFNAASFPGAGPSSTVVSGSTRQYVIGSVVLQGMGVGSTGLNVATFTTRTSTATATGPTDLLLASPAIALNLDALAPGRTAAFNGSTINISAVPEPSTYALMGLTVAGVGMYRRFRKSKKAVEVVA